MATDNEQLTDQDHAAHLAAKDSERAQARQDLNK
jgi:hypothetical protein